MKSLRLLPLLVCAFPPLALSCDDLTVRDSAFQEKRDVHRLSVIAAQGDATADKVYDRLSAWLDGPTAKGSGLNLELFRLDPADSNVHWQDFGIPSAPGSEQVPAVLLSGYQQAESRGFFIDVWQPAPSGEDLAVLLASRAREQLKKALPTNVAVLLYMPATDVTDRSGASFAEAAINEVMNERPDLTAPVAVVKVDRSDASEKTLASFTGAGVEGPDWLGVVFGRGKLLNPPLTGTEITAAGIRDLLDAVTAKCTCLNQASKMGVDIPMTWGADLDENIVKFQVSDEAIADATEATRAAEAQFEELLAPKTAEAAPTSAAAESVSNDRPMRTTLWVLGASLVILALSTVTFVRRRQA